MISAACSIFAITTGLIRKRFARAGFADIEVEVQIGQRALAFGDERLARHREHRVDVFAGP